MRRRFKYRYLSEINVLNKILSNENSIDDDELDESKNKDDQDEEEERKSKSNIGMIQFKTTDCICKQSITIELNNKDIMKVIPIRLEDIYNKKEYCTCNIQELDIEIIFFFLIASISPFLNLFGKVLSPLASLFISLLLERYLINYYKNLVCQKNRQMQLFRCVLESSAI